MTPNAIAAELTFHKMGDLNVVAVEGELLAGDDAKFRRLALEHDINVVALGSPGGNLAAGLEIGRIIQVQGYSTYVPAGVRCASACALAWLGGAQRFAEPESKIGFHAAYLDDDGDLLPTATGNALVGHYLSQLNLSRDAVVFATSASPYEISWLDTSTSGAHGIAFSLLGEADSSAIANAPSDRSTVSEGEDDIFATNPDNPPSDFIWAMATKMGFGLDITTNDYLAWISLNEPGKPDDYALSAGDMFREQGKRIRLIWMRGYHIKNPDVSYRETRTLMAFDCNQKRIQEMKFVSYSGDYDIITNSEEALDPYFPVPGTRAYGWLRAGCLDLTG